MLSLYHNSLGQFGIWNPFFWVEGDYYHDSRVLAFYKPIWKVRSLLLDWLRTTKTCPFLLKPHISLLHFKEIMHLLYERENSPRWTHLFIIATYRLCLDYLYVRTFSRSIHRSNKLYNLLHGFKYCIPNTACCTQPQLLRHKAQYLWANCWCSMHGTINRTRVFLCS